MIVGFRAPVELGGNSTCKGVRSFLELLPFLGFGQPVFHFFPGDRCTLSRQDFQSGKLAFRIHDALRYDSSSLTRELRRPTYGFVTRLDSFVSMFPNIEIGTTFLAGFLCSGTMNRYKVFKSKRLMKKKILVSCECKGTGFIAVADNGGEGVEHVECGQHHPAFKTRRALTTFSHTSESRQALAASSLSAAREQFAPRR